MYKFDCTLLRPLKGPLSPDDLRFFYYDVALGSEDSTQSLYDWDDSIESYGKNKRISDENKEYKL